MDWNLARAGPKRQRLAISSTAMKPMLWRFFSYLAPGFPRPAMMIMRSSCPVLQAKKSPAGRTRRGCVLSFEPLTQPCVARRAIGEETSGLFGFAFGGGVAGVRLASGRVLDRGDHEVAVGDDRRGAFRQLDVRDADVLADLAALQVDDQFGRDAVGADQDLDGVTHDFQHPALTGVGSFVSVDEGDRDFDLDLFLGADA